MSLLLVLLFVLSPGLAGAQANDKWDWDDAADVPYGTVFAGHNWWVSGGPWGWNELLDAGDNWHAEGGSGVTALLDGDSIHSGGVWDQREMTNSLSITATGPGTMSFWWSIDGHNDDRGWVDDIWLFGGDWCAVYLDGVKIADIRGAQNWEQVALNIPAGQHSIEWVFHRSADLNLFHKRIAWLDQFAWSPIPTTTLQEATEHPHYFRTYEGASPWFGQMQESADGVDAASSGFVLPGQASQLALPVTGPGELSFDWMVDCSDVRSPGVPGKEGDGLQVTIDGVPQDSITGTTAWANKTYVDPPG